jgi:hypothetical protein
MPGQAAKQRAPALSAVNVFEEISISRTSVSQASVAIDDILSHKDIRSR